MGRTRTQPSNLRTLPCEFCKKEFYINSPGVIYCEETQGVDNELEEESLICEDCYAKLNEYYQWLGHGVSAYEALNEACKWDGAQRHFDWWVAHKAPAVGRDELVAYVCPFIVANPSTELTYTQIYDGQKALRELQLAQQEFWEKRKKQRQTS